ncbi:MAG: biotin/lipoyl-binding protein [Desulfobulbaceae bacterium]|nr:biotin/lipoyl-binding protein [Desulfobulbaceae bacterium]HIJ79376.1 biotin/lipoyl-binding protein [Deltaproteobacteria bacterium]
MEAIALPSSVNFPVEPERPLPQLREDLELLPLARQASGAPFWNIYDPVRHAFFRIGWLEFEILSRWHLGAASKIAAEVSRETTLKISARQVEGVQYFLLTNQLLQPQTGRGFAAKAAAGQGVMHGFVQNHLYRRLPLFRPDAFLDASLPLVSFFYRAWFWKLTALFGLIGLYLVGRQWQEFSRTFLYFFTLPGLLCFSLTLVLLKLAHELAHAYTAKHFGLKVPVIGVAFIIIWPLFYTDTTDGWRLEKKEQRIKIGAAGVLFELAVAAYATLLWNFVGAGVLKSTLFLLTSATWLTSLAVNLNPFMRFDGYYLLSDLWEISNLQPRAFAQARWFLRGLLLGVTEPSPENLPAGKLRLLTCYGLATWIYRLLLYASIALVVYHLAFKVLGIVMFAVEIGWFLCLPIGREIKSYWQMRQKARLSRLLVTFSVLAALVAGLFYPWQSAVYVPALYRAPESALIFSPQSGQLRQLLVAHGQQLKKGDLLFELQSPELDYLCRQAERQVEKLKSELSRAGFVEEKAERSQVVAEQLTAALTALAGYREQQARLSITAPISGRLMELADDLRVGQWLNSSTRLGLIVGNGPRQVEGFLREQDVERVTIGTRGSFYPERSELPMVAGLVRELEMTHTEVLKEPYLASIYGGGVPVRRTAGGSLASDQSVYRFVLQPEGEVDFPAQILRGTVRLAGEPASLIRRMWLAIARVVIRESEF